MVDEARSGEPVLVDGEPALVVDATAAALRGHGVDARTARAVEGGDGGGPDGPPRAPEALVLLVPPGAEAAFRAAGVAGTSALPWGAIVDGRHDLRGAATADALLEAGASWVLGADAGLEAVVAALESMRVGDRPASRRPLPATPAARLATLTPRERAVLDAMADGRSVAETALLQGSTAATVRAHRRSVRVKLGVRSQLAAVALLFRQEAEDGAGDRPVAAVPGPRSGPGAVVPNLA